MYEVYLLAHNIDSPNDSVRLSGFEMTRASARPVAELRELFRTQEVYNDDWVLHSEYASLPLIAGPDPCQCGRIPFDVEDLLLTLRLFRSGDITFSRFLIKKPDQTSGIQAPYRVISESNSDSQIRYYLEESDGVLHDHFAQEMSASAAWNARWFGVARRFFLYGGAKELIPRWNEVDRIVDYMTALEATLVPEEDFHRARIANRGAVLAYPAAGEDQARAAQLFKKLYDIRSQIVHGSEISTQHRDLLETRTIEIEDLVREVLRKAIRRIPADDGERKTFLTGIFEPDDDKRLGFVIDKFRELRPTLRAETLRLLAKDVGT